MRKPSRRRAGIGLAVAAALVLIGALPAQAAVVPGTGPTTGGTTVQVDVAGASFTKVFGGPSAIAAYGLTDNNTLYAWGDNTGGQLGDGTATSRTVPTNVTASGALAGKTITQVAGGLWSTIALASDGTIYTWGVNTYGSLARPASTPSSTVPLAVPMTGVLAGKSIVQVASGMATAYALASDGTLFAWGYGTDGELGTASITQKNFSPVQVYLSGVTQIAASSYGAVAVANGILYAWGAGAYGATGNGTTTQHNAPITVTMSGVLSGKTIKSIAGTRYGYAALATDGTVATWGYGVDGELGNGQNTNSSVPVGVTGFGGKQIDSISSLAFGYVALATDGTEFSWGAGPLGDGTTNSSASPVSATTSGALSGKTITRVAGTNGTVLTVTSDGSIIGWGDATNGVLGTGTTSSSPQTSPTAATMPSVGFVVDGTAAAATRVTNTRYSFTAPPHAAGAVDVVVDVGGNAGYALAATTLAGGYSYVGPPIFTSIPPTAATLGSPFTSAPTVLGTSPITFAISAGSLPSGVTLSASTGVVSGTPTASGAFSFTVTATNAYGSASQPISLQVSAPPSYAGVSPLAANVVGQAYASSVAAPIGDGAITYTVTTGSLPAGLTLDPATGALAGTTTATGSTSFTVTATSVSGTATHQFTLIAQALPVIAPVTPAPAVVGVPYSLTITATGTGPVTYSVSSGSLPAGLTLGSTTGIIAGTPTASGTSTFTITATDGVGSSAHAVTVTTMMAPSFVSSSPSGAIVGTAYSYTPMVLGTGPLTFVVSTGSLPLGLTVNASTGVVSGTPTVSGAFTFTLTLTGAAGSASQAISVQVSVPPSYVGVSPVAATVVGQAYTSSVAAPIGDGAITYAVTTGVLPAGLTLDSTTGALTGTTTASGSTPFTVTATSQYGTATHRFTLVAQAFTVVTTTAPVAVVLQAPTTTQVVAPIATATPTPTPTPSSTSTPSSPPAPTPTATAPATPAPTAPSAPVSTPAPKVVIDIRVAVGADARRAPVTVRGSGLRAGSRWSLTMHSTPVVLASGVVPASGAMAMSMHLPATIPAGSHTLILVTTSATGAPAVARTWFGVTARKTVSGISTTGPVAAPAAHSPSARTGSGGSVLASTGFAAMPWIGGGAVLLIIGLGVLLRTRRRSGSRRAEAAGD